MTSGTINGRLSAEDIKRQAAGRWSQILASVCGLEPQQLNPKIHGPCPICGGNDRFRALDDVEESGALWCSKCHNKETTPKSGNGFESVQWLLNCRFPESLRKVAEFIGHSNGHLSAAKAPTKAKTVHATSDAAADALAWGMVQSGTLPEQRKPDAGWRYRNADGTDAGAVYRWNLPDGRKEIRQVSAVDGGWITSAMPEPRPLYRLPEIIDAAEVWICEGEKAADAAVSLGLQATTPTQGAKSPQFTDWSPLAGKRLYILPDNDEPGRKFVKAVCGLIRQQAPTAIMEVKQLKDIWPEIPEGGDIADWSEHFDSADAETLRARLAEIEDSLSEFVDVDGLNAGKQGAFVDSVDDFRPFPIDELPEPLARFCNEVADSVGCDPSFPALVALSVCSASVGTTRQVCIKRGWFAPGIIWGLLVGESGTQKSPGFRLAMAPMKERQQRDAEAFTADNARYQSEIKAFKRDAKTWERKQEGEEPEQPVRPVRSRCVVQDATIEALAPILNENPRGVLLARDELSGWLAGFDRYSGKSAASSEVPKWLEIYGCESITIDRKTGDERFLFVRRPFVSIAGGIQPAILSRVLTAEHKDNGLQSRLLMTFPPRQPKAWRDDEVSSATQSAYSDLIRALFELKPDTSGDESRPATLTLNDEARELYKAYVNRTGSEQSAMSGHLASQWSKLEETPARLAIILHSVRQVTSGVEDHWQIDELTMQTAINLAEWFKHETLRIGRLLAEPDELRQSRHLASWLHSQGGTITARDLFRKRRDIQTTEQAESLLIELVAAGFGSWRGIHKSREFVLNPQAVSTNAP
jgi:hypothetical protein